MRALSLVALAGCVTGLHASKPVLGETARPFALTDSDGSVVTLAGPTVLVFYRGHW
jgi:hypothetical protein